MPTSLAALAPLMLQADHQAAPVERVRLARRLLLAARDLLEQVAEETKDDEALARIVHPLAGLIHAEDWNPASIGGAPTVADWIGWLEAEEQEDEDADHATTSDA